MSEQTPDAGAPQKPQARLSAMGRLTGVLFSPVETFEDIARKPTWLVPLVLGIVLSLAMTVVLMPKMDMIGYIEYQMEKSGQEVDPEQLERIAEFSGTFMKVAWYAAAIFSWPVICLLVALVYFAVIRISKGSIRYGAAFSVVAWSTLPLTIKTVISTAALFRFPQESLYPEQIGLLVPSSLGWFLARGKEFDEITTPLISVASNLDVFAIWSAVLTILGLATVSSWSRGKCAGLVLFLWGLLVAIGAGFAALGGGG